MKKGTAVVLIFCILIVGFGVFLMVTKILNFGGLTGLAILEGGEDRTFGAFGIVAALIIVSGALIFLVLKIKGKNYSMHVEHDLR